MKVDVAAFRDYVRLGKGLESAISKVVSDPRYNDASLQLNFQDRIVEIKHPSWDYDVYVPFENTKFFLRKRGHQKRRKSPADDFP